MLDSRSIELHFEKSISLIFQLENTQNATMLKSILIDEPKEFIFRKGAREYEFEVDSDLSLPILYNDMSGPHRHEVIIKISGTELIATDIFIDKIAPPRAFASVEEFHYKNYDFVGYSFYRLLIPLTEKLDFRYYLERESFRTDIASYVSTSCKIQEADFAIVVIGDREQRFLSIESFTPLKHDDFRDKAFAIRNSLAFLTGYYAGDICYTISYSDTSKKEPVALSYQVIRESIKSAYNPMSVNPYQRLYFDRANAEKFKESSILRHVSLHEFSNLAEKVFLDVNFESAIVLILEASVSSLLAMPSEYAVALETIATLIEEDKGLTKRINPVADKKLWRDMRISLLKVVSNFEQKVGEGQDFETIRKRINSLNTPTNLERLYAPFDALRIPISEEDKVVIKSRNDFLHGRIPDITKAGSSRTLRRTNKDIQYCSYRFYTLLNALILKWIGYDGYIWNYPKIYEDVTGIPVDEELYRKI